MKTGARAIVAIAGVLVLCMTSLLFLINRSFLQLPWASPPLTFSYNIPYVLGLRFIQWVLGAKVMSILIANGLLMLVNSLLVFWLGWRIANPRYNFLGAISSLLLFENNPLIILLPLALGFLGGSLLAPILILVFLAAMLAMENWSAFMRAIVLSLIWSLFLWVHVPTALIVVVAMVPWVLYNRRPLVAVGVLVTMVLLGLFVFSALWMLGCALMQRWIFVKSPFQAASALYAYFQHGLSVTLSGSFPAISDRFIRLTGWLSPFLLILGLSAVAQTLRRMVQERRASIADLAALISLVILGVILCTTGKDTLPGAWYVLALLALWAPLVARDLALKENFYSRCFRTTAGIAFGVCGIVLWILQRDPGSGLTPDLAALVKVSAAVAVMGGLSHAIFRKHPLPLQNRIRAVLVGAALAYGLVLDCFLFR